MAWLWFREDSHIIQQPSSLDEVRPRCHGITHHTNLLCTFIITVCNAGYGVHRKQLHPIAALSKVPDMSEQNDILSDIINLTKMCPTESIL